VRHEPRKDHAIAMTRFARDCMARMKVVVVKLEVPVGPGTADLSMRFGLHSGPVRRKVELSTVRGYWLVSGVISILSSETGQ
jgi:hypothetical protein